MYRTDYLVCTKQVDQGDDLREAVYNAWNVEMTLISADDDDFGLIARIPDNNEFKVKVAYPSTLEAAEKTIHLDEYKIWIKNPNDFLIRFKDIDSVARICTVDTTPDGLSALK